MVILLSPTMGGAVSPVGVVVVLVPADRARDLVIRGSYAAAGFA
jgi:hypothetical protein